MNKSACITILMDNSAVVPSLRSEHGLSMWIEVGDKRILWDTGKSNGLFENARQLGVDIGSVNAIALSHGHYDHTGGLTKAMQTAPNAALYLHPNAMKPKYSLKNGNARSVGISRRGQLDVIEKETAGGVVYTNGRTALFNEVVLTGPVPRRTAFEDTGGRFFCDADARRPDELLDDQSLYLEIDNKLVVVVGCAHSGVVNILDAVSRWTGKQRIDMLVGGMHLINADTHRINKTVDAFKRYDIQSIVPLHCTGLHATQRLKEAFGSRYRAAGAGERICL